MTYESRIENDRVAIYLFHGVTDPVDCAVRNYTRKHISRDYFVDVIKKLKERGSPVSMEQIRQHYELGQPLPPRPFAVTFDDGFQNNWTVAAPILVDENVPATFYVATIFVEENRMGWIDRIEFAIEQRAHGRLRLPWGERRFAGDLERQALLTEIRRNVKTDKSIDADALATDIQQQLDVPVTYTSDHPLDRKLSWEEVRLLASERLFIVGGHSHSHKILSFLSETDLRQELDTSLRLLEDRAGIRSVHYSYPEGLSHCYSDQVIAALQERGIRCCPSAEDGVNDQASELFHLKRIMVT